MSCVFSSFTRSGACRELGLDRALAQTKQQLLGGRLVDPPRPRRVRRAQRAARSPRPRAARLRPGARGARGSSRRGSDAPASSARIGVRPGWATTPASASRSSRSALPQPLRREDGIGAAHARELKRHPEAIADPSHGLALDRAVGNGLEKIRCRLEPAWSGFDLARWSDVGLGGRELRLEARWIVGRVDPAWQQDDVDVEALPDGELHPAQRRRRARGVAVEREPEPLRQPAELAQLRFGERRPHARDDRLEAGLAQRDHVGVPLDDARAILLRDRLARLVEAVDDSPLCGRAPTRAC